MEDEEIQTKNTTIMANTADNRPQLLSVNEEDEEVNVSKPELKGTDVKKRNHNGETNFRDLTETTDFSSDLSCSFDVPVEYALHPFELAEKSQGKLGLCKPKNNKARLEQTALAQTQYQNQNQQKRPDDALSSVLLPFSASQGSNVTSMCSPALNRSKSFSSKPLSIVPLSKIPPHDGYNWRKYGQKQVKIPQGSRSYYRCTYSDCYAKKIECSDNTSRVMEIVYRSHHNHDPPQTQKPSSIRRSKSALVSPVKDLLTHEVGPTDDSVQSISSNEPVIEVVPAIDFVEPPEPSGSDEHPETDVMLEHVKETDPQKTLKRNASSYTESLTKPGKRSKHIVHTSGDVYISGDGYRWRKYGQKMVKGNPHPRNYYRCTSAGCPVRKHIERAKDNAEAFVITYKGKHDHEMTIQKKCEEGLITPQVVAGDDGSPPVTKSLEQASGEKTVESAKTLSSIGVEIETPPPS